MAPHVDSPAPSSDPATHLLGLLTRGRPSRAKTLAAWSIASAGLAAKAHTKWKAWQTSRAYSVSVCDLDDIYPDVQEWLLDRIPGDDRRGLAASTQRRPYTPGDLVAESDGTRTQRSVFLAYDGTRTQQVDFDGHPVTVTVEQRQYGKAEDGPRWGQPGRIIFTAANTAGRDAAIGFLQTVADTYEARRRGAQVHVATRWGDWQRIREVPARPIESVILTAGQRESLVDDLRRFMDDEDIYVRLGIPWHRGYLLHGPPGTGKTSIAKALAGHLGMDLFYLPLSDMKADTDLAAMLARVEPRSMLLLEDIDVVHAAKTRDDDSDGVSLSGLLNALDGVVTPHGLTTLMTTNNLSVLDDALVRVGRADQHYEIGYLDDNQLHRLVTSITGIEVAPDRLPTVENHDITPAQVVELLKPHLRADPAEAVALLAIELSELVDA